MEANLLTGLILPVALFIIMFGMGLALKPSDFVRVIAQPKAAIIGLCAQLLLLPLLAFLLALVFDLPAELAVGLMIISLAPGGATSNMFSYFGKGDVALSISLTAVVSLITPLTIPVVTLAAMSYFMQGGEAFDLPLIQTIIQLLIITVVPVVLGMFVRSKWMNFAAKLERGLSIFAIIFLFLIIVLILFKNKEQLSYFFMEAGLATLVLNVVAIAGGYFIAVVAKLNQSESTTIAFEVGLQNGTLALLVAGTIIGNSIMMIPAVTYSVLMFVTGFFFTLWVRCR